ncbi:MAG: GNAT family N-acetyltransferase [Oscillospiraceae bacterium]|nr:GNAT family N-acetyltransferase [Oscillospiraceae bacterium]
MDNIKIYSKQNRIEKSLFDEFFALMEQSFPTSERRDYEGFFAEFEHPCFHSICYQPERLAGVLNYYDFEDFIYIEHFAVSPELRGQGTGAALIGEIKRIGEGKKLVLEAEPPSDGDIACRRIGFYERLGFSLNEYAYIQPPLIKGEQPIPLVIMSFPERLSEKEYLDIRSVLYREVYSGWNG